MHKPAEKDIPEEKRLNGQLGDHKKVLVVRCIPRELHKSVARAGADCANGDDCRYGLM